MSSACECSYLHIYVCVGVQVFVTKAKLLTNEGGTKINDDEVKTKTFKEDAKNIESSLPYCIYRGKRIYTYTLPQQLKKNVSFSSCDKCLIQFSPGLRDADQVPCLYG